MLLRMNYIHQKTPNGTFYYRRRLPSDLVKFLGQKEVKLSLKTRDPIIAQAKAKRMSSKLEAKWQTLRKPKAVLTEAQSLVSSLNTTETFTQTFHEIGEITYDEDGWCNFIDTLDNRKPSAVEEKALQIKYETITLSDAIENHIITSGKQSNRKFVSACHRSLSFFTDELTDKALNTYTRREIEGVLIKGIQVEGFKTKTVSRRLSDVKSAVNKAILSYEYQFNNPFEKHKIPNLGDDEESRTSLSKEQQESLLALFIDGKGGDTLNALKILFDTGMRVAEVAGLKSEDIDLEHKIPHIKLQRNPFRPLKTKQSKRLIPLMGHALEGVKSQLTDSEWLFPRYIDEDNGHVKNDGASATFNKRIKPLGFTCHSLRHNFKDRLRLANVPMDNIKDLQGWARGDQASKYGEMSLLQLLYNDMMKADVWVDPWDF
ncbi:MAG TPA: hypothetical protein EYP92_07745 [Candidatus Thioglobus sp.]|nr:hypothetical protein [Candidatus Thioglobus sp.]